MVSWLLILILGAITYLILQQRVTTLTHTPVWILWLVLMTPAFIWIAWYAFHDESQPMPPTLVFGPFVVCFFLYWFLVQWGKVDLKSSDPEPESSDDFSENNSDVADALDLDRAQTVSEVRALTVEEEKLLRDCFPWTVYPLHSIDYRLQAAICRGQLRAKSEIAYERITKNIEAKFGDRFLVIFQEDFHGKPLFVLVPNPQRAQDPETNIKSKAKKVFQLPIPEEQLQSLNKPGLAIALAAITLFTTTLIGTIRMAGIERTALQSNPNLLLAGLPYGLALMAIIGIHEYAHFLTATFYKLQALPPYFIPFPEFIGTFGAFTKVSQPMPNRKVLFDVSIAGPIASFLLTIPILMWGLAHSTVVDLPKEVSLLSIDALNPSFSFLLTLLSKISLPSALGANQGIDLHPVAVAGYIGLILTAFNLMPVGALDGGHIVHAMFGQKMAITIGQITRFLFFILAIAKPELLPWAVFLFIIPVIDSPALNDVTELDNKRDLLGLFALFILVLIIVPAPSILLPS